jgi:hypothetical protein
VFFVIANPVDISLFNTYPLIIAFNWNHNVDESAPVSSEGTGQNMLNLITYFTIQFLRSPKHDTMVLVQLSARNPKGRFVQMNVKNNSGRPTRRWAMLENWQGM